MKKLRKIASLVYLLIVSTNWLLAQDLLPSIGISSIPQDTDPICDFQCSIDPDGTFMQVGPMVGDTVPDFTFYDTNDNAFNMLSSLQSGKPVMLIGGNYTCPYFRSRRNLINDLQATYGNDLTIAVFYTVEAHPENDSSIYFCDYNQQPSNVNQGILYDMATTYGERKSVVNDMLNNLVFDVPVYLDGPCNEWLTHFGPAPSCAYLVNANGVVFSKHGWLNKPPLNIYTDIDSLLGNVVLPPPPANGEFIFTVSDSIIYGIAGDELVASGTLTNYSTGDALIEVVREQNNVPGQWQTSMCVDACLPPTADTTLFLLPAGSSQSFHMHFYTDSSPDQGEVLISFRNVNDPFNEFEQNFYANTETTTIMSTQNLTSYNVDVYPNPGTGIQYLEVSSGSIDSQTKIRLDVYDLQGRQVGEFNYTGAGKHLFSMENAGRGLYTYLVFAQDVYQYTGKLVIR